MTKSDLEGEIVVFPFIHVSHWRELHWFMAMNWSLPVIAFGGWKSSFAGSKSISTPSLLLNSCAICELTVWAQNGLKEMDNRIHVWHVLSIESSRELSVSSMSSCFALEKNYEHLLAQIVGIKLHKRVKGKHAKRVYNLTKKRWRNTMRARNRIACRPTWSGIIISNLCGRIRMTIQSHGRACTWRQADTNATSAISSQCVACFFFSFHFPPAVRSEHTTPPSVPKPKIITIEQTLVG